MILQPDVKCGFIGGQHKYIAEGVGGMRALLASVAITTSLLTASNAFAQDPCANVECPTNCPQGLCAIQRFGNECSAYCASLQVPNIDAAIKSAPFDLHISNMPPETARKIQELLEQKK